MFGRRFRSESRKAQEGDERLSMLLREWKGATSPPNFEAAVWRRIRIASAPEQRRLRLVTTLREWLVPRPAWANTMAAAAGIVVGVGLAFSTPVAHGGRSAAEPLLDSQTLAGSYLAMVTGETR